MDTPETQRPQAVKPPAGYVGEDTLMWHDITPEDEHRDAMGSMHIAQTQFGFSPAQAQRLYGGAGPSSAPPGGQAGPPPGFVPEKPTAANGPPPGFVPAEQAEPDTSLRGDIAHEFHAGLGTIKHAHDEETQRRLGILPSKGKVRDFLGEFAQIAGGLFTAGTSPVMGAARHVARNVAGTMEPTTKTFAEMSPSERARASARKPFEKTGTEEEQLERATNVLAAMLPVTGVGGGAARSLFQAAARPARPVMETFEQIFSPTTVDANARQAEAIIRGAGGRAARDTAMTAKAMEPFHATINAMPEADRLSFIDHIEGGPARIANLSPQLQTLARGMREAFEYRAQKLASLPSTATTHFIEDYFPHMWQDPGAAAQFARQFSGGAGRQGSGASLHARSIPTVADGLRAGLVPITTDPIEATMRYVNSMDRFIAATSTLDIARELGQVRYIRPRVMGASGHPESFRVPDGWAPIKGRGAVNANGAQAYAPEGFARVYNNFIDRGVHEWGPTGGSVYDAMLRTSNAITGLELGLSGYHAVTMANEAALSRLATGIKDIVGGAGAGDAMRLLRGAGKVATSPAAFITSPLKGRQMERVYLGQTPGAPDMDRVVNLLERAGGRAVNAKHATDYQFSAAGSYWKAFRQGALRMQMATAAADIRANPILGSARQAATVLGRTMSTIAAPLFETYIPRLKNGAFYDAMHSWLEANPAATYEAQVAQARQIWDSIDNRFGELVDDNIFWNKTLKQAAKLAMRSYSWNLGTVREIGGGVADIARGRFSDRAAYVIALPFWVGTMNAAYQYLKTGKAPESVQDLVGGQTGGEQTTAIPSTQPYHRSARSTVPERVQIPGYQKDVMGWYENWEQEAQNKLARGPSMVMEMIRNQDWRGDPILNPEDSAPQWLKSFFEYVGRSLTPISLQSLTKGRKEGSALTVPEQMGGLRPSPPYVADPEGYERQQHNLNVLRQKKKAAFERRQQRDYGGTDE